MNSNKLISSFQSFLQTRCGADKNNKFLVAVSGGIDSVVMADLFLKCRYSFAITHCNFNLRGEESNGDEDFVKELAGKYQVKVFTESFDTLKVTEEENLSIQMAARKLRYEWFEKLRVENDFDYIVTAHHKQDSTETVLLNITRGTGLEGLKGIAAKNNFIIRPLLFATREKILQYATEQNLKWREDSSNATTDYQRNFIRHKVIPLLQEINPAVDESINNLSFSTSESLVLLNEVIEKYRTEHCIQSGDDFILNTEKIINHPAKKTLLFHLFAVFNFNSSQIESMISGNKKTGIVFYSKTHRLIINRNQFIVSPLTNNKEAINYLIHEKDCELHLSDETLQLNLFDNINPVDLKKNNTSIVFVDASKIKFPLLLRRWQKGDYFYPLGMDHRKKLSDYFVDEKFSLADKERTWLLLNSNDDIIWIVNHRIDNRYSLTDQTKKAIQLQYLKLGKNGQQDSI